MGAALDTVEQFVEEQNLDPLFSEKYVITLWWPVMWPFINSSLGDGVNIVCENDKRNRKLELKTKNHRWRTTESFGFSVPLWPYDGTKNIQLNALCWNWFLWLGVSTWLTCSSFYLQFLDAWYFNWHHSHAGQMWWMLYAIWQQQRRMRSATWHVFWKGWVMLRITSICPFKNCIITIVYLSRLV